MSEPAVGSYEKLFQKWQSYDMKVELDNYQIKSIKKLYSDTQFLTFEELNSNSSVENSQKTNINESTVNKIDNKDLLRFEIFLLVLCFVMSFL
jgi:hypothetical protein